MKHIILAIIIVIIIILISNRTFENFNTISNNKSLITIDNSRILLKLNKLYGTTHNLMPNSYILNDYCDMKLFNTQYKPEKLYILEKYDKRKIVDDREKIKNFIYNGYKVVRELNYNPYLVNNYKINLEFYVLNINNKWYVHIDGNIYYFIPYPKTSIDLITKINNNSPKTLLEFKNYLDKQNRPFTDHELWYRKPYKLLSNNVFNRCYDALQLICSVLESKSELYLITLGLDHKLQPILEKISKNINDNYINNKIKNDLIELKKNKISNKNQFIGLYN